MILEDRMPQIEYLGHNPEMLRRDVWEGWFLVMWDDEQKQKITVELSMELRRNIQTGWPEIDSDPGFLICRLGKKAIQAQLRQRGEVDKVICLYKDRYPGCPGRPDV